MSDVETAVAEMVAEGSPETSVGTEEQSELEALRARIRELEAVNEVKIVRTEVEPDYAWPKMTEEQRKRNIVGGQAVTRVVKVTYTDPEKRFWSGPQGKTVHIGQHRVPMADGKWDVDRLFLELRRNKLVLLEEAFAEAPHYCEINECWDAATDGSFCTNRHRDAALSAHERMYKFE
jgi:hypothetical protein